MERGSFAFSLNSEIEDSSSCAALFHCSKRLGIEDEHDDEDEHESKLRKFAF